MAYTYDFKDNVVYGANDINAVRTSVLTKGVVEETAFSCKVLNHEDGVNIMPGQAIFGDGCRIAIDEEGVLKEITAGAVNYVYLFNNTLAGICEVLTDTIYPTGDYVLLAEVDTEGNVSDKREFAQLKTADVQRYAESFTAQLALSDTLESGSVIGSVTLPKSGCSLIDFDIRIENDARTRVRLLPKDDNFAVWTPEVGVFSSGYVVETYAYGKYRNLRFEVSGNVMTVTLDYISKKGTDTLNLYIAGVCMR